MNDNFNQFSDDIWRSRNCPPCPPCRREERRDDRRDNRRDDRRDDRRDRRDRNDRRY